MEEFAHVGFFASALYLPIELLLLPPFFFVALCAGGSSCHFSSITSSSSTSYHYCANRNSPSCCTGGGVQGTAMAPPAIAAAGLAVAQWEWHTILPVAPLRPGYKDRCVHFFEVPPHLQATR